MTAEPRVSVIVPTYERKEAVVRLLQVLRAQTLPADQFEVLVVIDGSEDGTREAVEGFEAPFALRSIWQENRGRAAAVNIGIEQATGEIVVFIDDDLEPLPDYLAAHAEAHERGGRIGVVGTVLFRLDPSTPPFARFWALRFEDFLTRLAARPSGPTWAETYTGAFSALRADLLEVGGYDEAFDGYGLEDFELALRLERVGVTFELSKEAAVYHHYRKDFRDAARAAESRGRSAVIFATLHPDVAADFGPRDLAPPSAARRLVRYVLPRMTLTLPFVAQVVTWLVGLAERRRFRKLEFVYTLGLEYFYLLGLLEASRDGRLTAKVDRP
jgi:GT2 family glycosyltransferase